LGASLELGGGAENALLAAEDAVEEGAIMDDGTDTEDGATISELDARAALEGGLWDEDALHALLGPEDDEEDSSVPVPPLLPAVVPEQAVASHTGTTAKLQALRTDHLRHTSKVNTGSPRDPPRPRPAQCV